MPNGKQVISDIEYEQHIKYMDDRQLLEFTARQVYDLCVKVSEDRKRIDALEKHDQKAFGTAGGIGAVIGAAIATVIDYFIRRSLG